MVSFQLDKEIEKVFLSNHKHGKRKKILSPHEESNLRPLDSTIWCSSNTPDKKKNTFLHFFTKLKTYYLSYSILNEKEF